MDSVSKLQLRVGHSNVGITGRNVRLRYAIMVHRDCGHFCIRNNGSRISTGFLRAQNHIVLRGINKYKYI